MASSWMCVLMKHTGKNKFISVTQRENCGTGDVGDSKVDTVQLLIFGDNFFSLISWKPFPYEFKCPTKCFINNGKWWFQKVDN